MACLKGSWRFLLEFGSESTCVDAGFGLQLHRFCKRNNLRPFREVVVCLCCRQWLFVDGVNRCVSSCPFFILGGCSNSWVVREVSLSAATRAVLHCALRLFVLWFYQMHFLFSCVYISHNCVWLSLLHEANNGKDQGGPGSSPSFTVEHRGDAGQWQCSESVCVCPIPLAPSQEPPEN